MTTIFRSVLTLTYFLAVQCDSLVRYPSADMLSVDKESYENKMTMKDQIQPFVDSRNYLCPGYQWYDDLNCTDDSILLSIGHCITYIEGNSTFVTKCPYFELMGHNMTEPGYIKLPDNISELNDYMCGPMNRKGFLCEDCIDGFAVSVTSVGYKCSNYTGVWYGVPLYLALELVPITVFYLFILVFQIHITSAPMTSFVMYSQMVMFVLIIDRPSPLEKIVPQYENNLLFNVNLFLYGMWNLDSIHYIVPPFCISSDLNLTYAILFGYISVFYPLCLTILTWFCIELHGRNFRLIVSLWRPFHKCFVKLRREWNVKSDIIDVFSAFFLLSYSKLMYQSTLLVSCQKVTYLNHTHWGIHNYIMKYDSTVACGSSKYIYIALPAIISLCVFNILPALLLVLYPIKAFRACIFRCRLDSLSVSAFMEKFHGCYRNGLDGGKDMRSFAGLYFFLRFLPFLYYPLKLYEIPISLQSYIVSIFLGATLLVALIRPYKQRYMNVLDILLLAHFTLVTQLLLGDYFDSQGIQLWIINLIPAFSLGLFLFLKLCLKVRYKYYCRKNTLATENVTERNISEHNKQSLSQPLITPTSNIIDTRSYGSINQDHCQVDVIA